MKAATLSGSVRSVGSPISLGAKTGPLVAGFSKEGGSFSGKISPSHLRTFSQFKAFAKPSPFSRNPALSPTPFRSMDTPSLNGGSFSRQANKEMFPNARPISSIKSKPESAPRPDVNIRVSAYKRGREASIDVNQLARFRPNFHSRGSELLFGRARRGRTNIRVEVSAPTETVTSLRKNVQEAPIVERGSNRISAVDFTSRLSERMGLLEASVVPTPRETSAPIPQPSERVAVPRTEKRTGMGRTRKRFRPHQNRRVLRSERARIITTHNTPKRTAQTSAEQTPPVINTVSAPARTDSVHGFIRRSVNRPSSISEPTSARVIPPSAEKKAEPASIRTDNIPATFRRRHAVSTRTEPRLNNGVSQTAPEVKNSLDVNKPDEVMKDERQLVRNAQRLVGRPVERALVRSQAMTRWDAVTATEKIVPMPKRGGIEYATVVKPLERATLGKVELDEENLESQAKYYKKVASLYKQLGKTEVETFELVKELVQKDGLMVVKESEADEKTKRELKLVRKIMALVIGKEPDATNIRLLEGLEAGRRAWNKKTPQTTEKSGEEANKVTINGQDLAQELKFSGKARGQIAEGLGEDLSLQEFTEKVKNAKVQESWEDTVEFFLQLAEENPASQIDFNVKGGVEVEQAKTAVGSWKRLADNPRVQEIARQLEIGVLEVAGEQVFIAPRLNKVHTYFAGVSQKGVV